MRSRTFEYILIIALLSLTGFFSINLYFHQRSAQDKLEIRTFPYTVEDWKGRDLEVKEYEYDILETRNLILREYANPSGDKLTLFIIYSETNRSVFHPPEVCLIGSGITIVNKNVEKINYGRYPLSVNKLFIEKSGYKGLDLYCYKAGNHYTDNYYLQQAYFALNQFFGKHVRGATIRVSMPLKLEEKTTLSMLKAFMQESAKIIDKL